MGFIRSCYSTNACFWSNRPDIVDNIVWGFAQPGAHLFPYVNNFYSRNWVPRDAPACPVGEVKGAPRPYRKGQIVTAAPGTAFTGDPEWFRLGAPWERRTTAKLDVFGDLSNCTLAPQVDPFLFPDSNLFTVTFTVPGNVVVGVLFPGPTWVANAWPTVTTNSHWIADVYGRIRQCGVGARLNTSLPAPVPEWTFQSRSVNGKHWAYRQSKVGATPPVGTIANVDIAP